MKREKKEKKRKNRPMLKKTTELTKRHFSLLTPPNTYKQYKCMIGRY